LYQFINKIRGFLLAIMIGFGILEIFEEFDPRKEKLITKRTLILNRGTRTCFSKTSNYYYSN
jgi:hypothetical protein